IPDLIVVLGINDEAGRWDASRRVPMTTATIYRIVTGIHETLRERLCHVLKMTEVCVVALAFPGQQRVQRMMKIIVPLRIEAISSKLLGANDTRVVQRAFRDDVGPAIQLRAALMHGLADLLEKVQSGVVENRVNCVESQSVGVVVGNPLECVCSEEEPDLVA